MSLGGVHNRYPAILAPNASVSPNQRNVARSTSPHITVNDSNADVYFCSGSNTRKSHLRTLAKHVQVSLEMESASPPTRFGDLPLELRQEIWRLVLPGPRLISVNRFSKPPLALHINRESRSIALQHYELFAPQHRDDDEDGFGEGHRCVAGYIDFEVDIIHIACLRACGQVYRKICHLQDNCALWQQISSARIFVMTDFAILKFPRLRSFKTILDYDPNIRGVEFRNLPTSLTAEEFQTRVQVGAEAISRRIEEIKAERTQAGVSWTPPEYHFVRCQWNAFGFKCDKPMRCEGTIDIHVSGEMSPR